jgi:hypothetical protein
MDAFVSRKKRKLSSAVTPTTIEDINALSAPDDESTDFKLALLSSLHPYLDQQVLLDILLAHDGSVEAAATSLKPSDSPPRKSSAANGLQSSLSSFVAQKYSSAGPAKQAKLLSKKGKTLHLYDPADIAAHTPCSIIHNFLPTEDANALLEELLKESPTFERITFKLFENVVQSPHTACFYVESQDEMQIQKTDYIYNGALLTVSLSNSWLKPYSVSLFSASHAILSMLYSDFSRMSENSRPKCEKSPLSSKKQSTPKLPNVSKNTIQTAKSSNINLHTLGNPTRHLLTATMAEPRV